MRGVVIKSTGSWYSVRMEDGDIWSCRIKGKFRMKGIKTTNPVAVGDLNGRRGKELFMTYWIAKIILSGNRRISPSKLILLPQM